MKKTFRVGVIGAGAIAQSCHLPGYAAAKHCVLAAVADPEARCVDEAAAKGFKFQRRYADWREMLRTEDLDVVSICTPNYLHKEMAVAAAKQGCDILLEKPVAVTMKDALAIRAAVKKHKVRLMVGFTHRFNELNVAARAALKAGKIGKPYMARVRFAHRGPWPGWAKTDWFYNPKQAGGGAALDMGIHAFDLLQWYLGPVTAAQGRAVTLRKKIKVDDNCVAILEFGNKALAYVEVGWTSPAGYSGVELMGDNGAIFVNYSENRTVMIRGDRKPDGTCRQETTVLAEQPKVGGWAAEMRHFTEQLKAKGPFAVGIDDGVAGLKVATAVFQSSRTGRRVVLR